MAFNNVAYTSLIIQLLAAKYNIRFIGFFFKTYPLYRIGKGPGKTGNTFDKSKVLQ